MKFKPIKIEENIQPKVILTSETYYNLFHMTKTPFAQQQEFCFQAEVTRDNNIFLVTKVFIVPQNNNSPTHCETSEEKLQEYYLEKYPNPMDRKKIRLHGHSHVFMATIPSGTDDDDLINFSNYVSDFYIQLIINNKMCIRANVMDIKANLIIEDTPVYVVMQNKTVLDITNKKITNLKLTTDDLLKSKITKIDDNIIKIGDNLTINIKTLTTKIIVKDDFICTTEKIDITIIEDKELTKQYTDDMDKYIEKPTIIPMTINDPEWKYDLYNGELFPKENNYGEPLSSNYKYAKHVPSKRELQTLYTPLTLQHICSKCSRSTMPMYCKDCYYKNSNKISNSNKKGQK
mgnify:CR=1 FL=1